MREISVRALLIATVASFGASFVYSSAIILIVTRVTGLADAAAFRAYVAESVPFAVGAIAASLAISLGIGYLAAAIAKQRALLHGALSAGLYVAGGIYSLVANVAPEFQTRNLVLTVAAPVFGLLGGYLWQRRNRAA